MDLTLHKQIDKKLTTLCSKYSLLKALIPKNYAEVKARFLSGKTKNPNFHYKIYKLNKPDIEREINEIKFPQDQIGDLLQKKAHEIKSKSQILRNLGNEDIVLKNSINLYGKVHNNTVEKAKKELANLDASELVAKTDLEAEDVKAEIERFLQEHNIRLFKVKLADQPSVSVEPKMQTINISKQKRYTKLAAKRLVVHEIMTHVYRNLNGSTQPLKIFANGFPAYLETEEGIAAFLEEQYDVQSLRSKKRFALRVLAADAVHKGADFLETFELIKKYEQDDDKAWEIVFRVFRGGKFVKDHIYFQGLLKIKKFLKKGGQLQDLFIGKIALDNVTICRKLLEEKILERPKHLPKVFLS